MLSPQSIERGGVQRAPKERRKMFASANVTLLRLLAKPADLHVLDHRWRRAVVLSSFIETSCLTGWEDPNRRPGTALHKEQRGTGG